MTEPSELSAIEARTLIGHKKLSSTELVKSCLEQMKKYNNDLNAIVCIDEDDVLFQAKTADNKTLKGEELGLIHGLPVGIKDLQMVKNLKSTYGSLLYKDNVPTSDDTIVQNIRNEGGIIFGKTNTPEFGAGANTKNKVYGATGNPFNYTYTSAGSSGGSAAALALNMVSLATGSDYGGSLRTPAGFCGVTGFRPSPGMVPTVESSIILNPFSVFGPMARDVSDTFLLLQSIIDINDNDIFSNLNSLSLPDQLKGADLSSIKMAFSSDLGCAPVDNDIKKVFTSKMNLIKSNFKIAENEHPNFLNIHDCFEVIRGFNYVASHLEKVKKSKNLLGPNVVDNVERGLKFTMEDITWGHQEQSKIYANFRKFFEVYDVLICPAASVSPFPHENLFVKEINGKSLPTYMRWLALSYAPTMAIPCAWALPCGFDHKNMPFGIQLVAPAGNDTKLSEIALSIEQILSSHDETKRPVPKAN